MEGTVRDFSMNTASDYENLKVWQNNACLDYYLSDDHWNYHVNQLIYKYLLVRHDFLEVGLYLDMGLLARIDEGSDYSVHYGRMFNEAYRQCSVVLCCAVPETMVPSLVKDAAAICTNKAAKLIFSYHVMVMVNFILCFADIQKSNVGRFLHRLSFYDDMGCFFLEKQHHFAEYIKVGLNTVAGALIDGQIHSPGLLRPEYDYKGRDEYLRRTIPWYRVLAEELDKKVEVQDNDAQGVPNSPNYQPNSLRRGSDTANGGEDINSNEELAQRLLATSVVFKLSEDEEQQKKELLRLYKFIKNRFVENIKHKYEWYALRRFLDKYNLLNECDNEEFASQMNKEEWFGYLKNELQCSAYSMNTYNYLRDEKSSNNWIDKAIPEGSRASKSAVKRIYLRYENLVLYDKEIMNK